MSSLIVRKVTNTLNTPAPEDLVTAGCVIENKSESGPADAEKRLQGK